GVPRRRPRPALPLDASFMMSSSARIARSMMAAVEEIRLGRFAAGGTRMLTEENERLTRVGPGTPMGTLLRRYWHPIAVTSQFLKPGTKPVRVLGEDLVLYRDRTGKLGLVAQRCPHRRAG